MNNSETFEIKPVGEREIVMMRQFSAPADLVFEALTKPALVQRWCLGPPGWTMPVCKIDLEVGGAWKYVWRSDADGREFDMSGEYREIKRPERIVHTERFEEGESLVTSVLQEKNGQTTLAMTMLFESRAARDGAIESGMGDGVAASYDRLEEIVGQK